jgi:hypothetical protein
LEKDREKDREKEEDKEAGHKEEGHKEEGHKEEGHNEREGCAPPWLPSAPPCCSGDSSLY